MLFTSVDFQKSGKQQGCMQVPYSHNLGGWANVMIPITTVANGTGPTVLILGGNHGDEYQGQIAAMKLARELTPDMVTGRIILIPSLNFPAARAATRLSPLDGMNMNRAFPGSPEGSVTSQIAHFLTTVLFPLSDVVIDIHSGGRSMEFVPCAHMHCSPRSHCVHYCALLYIGLRTLGNGNDVLHSTLDNGHACLHMVTLTCGALCALLYDMEDGSLHA